MNKTQIIAETKALFLKGKTSDALTQLHSFLESDDKYDELAGIALQLKSQLAKVKNDEALNVISYENAQLSYNRIGKGFTNLLDRLENDNLKEQTPSQAGNSKLLIGIITGLVVLTVAFFVFKDSIFQDEPTEFVEQEPDKTEELSSCPTFDNNSDFNILILPFIRFGKETPNFEESFRQRFSNYRNRLNFKIDSEIYKPQENETVKPEDNEAAAAIAQTCSSPDPVNLVIWGFYEQKSEDNTIITTSYKFLNAGDNFSFDQINVGGNLEPVTVSSISSIATQGVATADIEQLLLGIAANQVGDKSSAIALLENLTPPDSATLLLWGMILADSYLEIGDKAKAITSYDKVLETHPDYRFALLNRAMLNYETGKKEEAMEDLDHTLKINPEDTQAKLSRANIYVKENQLDKAGKDLSDLEKANLGDDKVKLIKKDYDSRMETEQRKKKTAKRTLQRDPSNIKALNDLSESSIRLGDYQTALKANKKITELKPKNKKAWANVLYLSKELKIDYQEVIKDANSAGITNDQLRQLNQGFKKLSPTDLKGN